MGHDGRAAGEHPLGDAPRRPDRHQRPAGAGLRRAPGDIGLGVWEIPAYTRAVPAPRPAADPAALAAAVDLIAAAKRPLLITGGGTILSGAGSAVGDLSERFGIPIQTTPAGRGSVAETHPLFCGLTGLYRTTFPRRVYEAADLLITVGSRMEEFQGGFLPFRTTRS